MLGEKKKPKKKRKRKSPSKPKMRSALDVARNPQPYQIPLYMPPFPSVINNQPKQPSIQNAVANVLRNYNAVNSAELKRLRGDLTAYRQEQQTAFNRRVAYPRATVNLGSFDGDSISASDISGSDISDLGSSTTAAETDSDYVPSSSFSFSNSTEGIRAKQLVRKMFGSSSSDISNEIATDAAIGELSDFSIGKKKVSFGEPMDLTSGGESDFAPRASQKQRATRRARVYVDNASNRRLGRVGKSY